MPETKNRTFDEIAALFKIVKDDRDLEESSADHQSVLDENTMSNGKSGFNIAGAPFTSYQGKN